MKALLLLCRPWLVAVPVPAIRRILLPEQATCTATHAEADGVRAPLLDLGRLLRLDAPCDQALVLMDHGRGLLALRTGRCLSVTDLPNLHDVPPATQRAPSPLTRAFAAGDLARAHDAAPLGLWLDPARLAALAGIGA